MSGRKTSGRLRAVGMLGFAAMLVWAALAAADEPIGGACSAVAGDGARNADGNNEWCNGSTWQYPAYQFGATAATCNSTNAGIITWTGAACGPLQGCDGTTWQILPSTVSNSYGETMVCGWPDALSCNVSSPSQGTTIFFAAQMPYSGDGLYHYRYSSGGTNYDVEFTSAGAFSAYANLTTTNCNTSILSLYASGQAFNLVKGTVLTGYQPSTPTVAGYFVLSQSTFTGNLGKRAGANASCLTELTTKTGWLGYSTANANGQLDANHVHAFIEFDEGTDNLVPNATYYFANAGNSGAGGASFTTNSTGLGPNDSANWSGATYFSATATYWTNMSSGSATAWGGAENTASACVDFSDATSTDTKPRVGLSASTTGGRWRVGTGACNNSYPIICYVDP